MYPWEGVLLRNGVYLVTWGTFLGRGCTLGKGPCPAGVLWEYSACSPLGGGQEQHAHLEESGT